MSTKEVKNLASELTNLKLRISQLVDEMATLKAELKHFKSAVADDVKYLTDRVDG